MLVICSTGVYVSLNGNIIPNHGYVMISDIGSTVNTALLCHTNRRTTIGNSHSGGDWFAPDRTRVGGIGTNYVLGFWRNRGPTIVRLFRSTASDPPAEGMFSCVIEDDTLTKQTVYVGLYNGGGGILHRVTYHEQRSSVIFVAGTLSVSSDVTFTLEPNFMFTLTCISTGGPATTVTWTRDSVTVTGTQRSLVEDRVTAQYTHTLTIHYNHTLIEMRQLEGLYKCSVSNAVSSASSSEFYVHGIQ